MSTAEYVATAIMTLSLVFAGIAAMASVANHNARLAKSISRWTETGISHAAFIKRNASFLIMYASIAALFLIRSRGAPLREAVTSDTTIAYLALLIGVGAWHALAGLSQRIMQLTLFLDRALEFVERVVDVQGKTVENSAALFRSLIAGDAKPEQEVVASDEDPSRDEGQ